MWSCRLRPALRCLEAVREAGRNPFWPLLTMLHLAWAEPAFTLEEEHLFLISTTALSTHRAVHVQGPPPSQRGRLFLILTKVPDRLGLSPKQEQMSEL